MNNNRRKQSGDLPSAIGPPPAARRGGTRRTAGSRRRTGGSRRISNSSQSSNNVAPAPVPAAVALNKPPPAASADYAPKIATIYAFAKEVVKKGVTALREEFRPFRSIRAEAEHAAFDANPRKARYRDVVCGDHSRVILKNHTCDFIHANFVVGEHSPHPTFICCQGPLPHTAPDFWAMVWQEHVDMICMLCRTVEGGRPKCAQYWPRTTGERMIWGSWLVDCLSGFNDALLATCKLRLTNMNSGEQRLLYHRQWVSWPDKFVPQHVEPIFRMLEQARVSRYPTVVHCSAGIGRTGTVVLIEHVQRALHSGVAADVRHMLAHLRKQRLQAVQTEDQYVFVHYAILQKILQIGAIRAAEVRPFFQQYEDYMRSLGAPMPIPMVESAAITRQASTTTARQELNKPKSAEKVPETREPASTITCIADPMLLEARYNPGTYFAPVDEKTQKAETSKQKPKSSSGSSEKLNSPQNEKRSSTDSDEPNSVYIDEKLDHDALLPLKRASRRRPSPSRGRPQALSPAQRSGRPKNERLNRRSSSRKK